MYLLKLFCVVSSGVTFFLAGSFCSTGGSVFGHPLQVEPSTVSQTKNTARETIGRNSIDFSRDVLPILSDYCYACHGPDAATREGGFRLDDQASAFGEADSGEHPVVPGDLDASELIRRLKSSDDFEQMPPPESKKRPTADQIRILEQWIREGAPWKEHWAFVAPVQTSPPDVENKKWIRNPIDHFVLAKLESLDMSPSGEAGKTTLIRRLYLDLLGLPPTPQQVDEFLADQSPDAYENLVDRLLESPQYGEHMATAWLDAARFADTNGYQNDFRRSMWLWRDWVITAFNNNMPFDQFTIEQLAGDMLPDATLEQKIASGFNRNHRTNTEGGSIDEEWLVENVVDRVETTSAVFLGLTMGCARCHDHKYDPVSQREFYEFFAFFNNVDERGVYNEKRGNAGPIVSVPTPEFTRDSEELNRQLDIAESSLKEIESGLKEEQQEWESQLASDKPDDETTPEPGVNDFLFAEDSLESSTGPVAEIIAAATGTHHFVQEAIGPVIDIQSGENQHLDMDDVYDFDPETGFTVSVWVRPTSYGAIISRMDEQNNYRGFDMLIMPDGRLNVHLIHNWPKNATKITTVTAIPKERWTHVVVSVEPPGKAANIAVWFNNTSVSTTVDADSLAGTTKTDHPVWLGLRALTPPYIGKISGLVVLTKAIDETTVSGFYKTTLDRLVTNAATGPDEPGLRQEIDHQFRQSHHGYRQALDERDQKLREKKQLQARLPTTMVMKELTEARPTYVLKRGAYDQPDKEQQVSPEVPALFKSETRPTNRLELARWLVDGNNPLTARVAVNQYWSRYFGTGLLETPENFGVQSPPPSHPELLDWLAVEFALTGWDIKKMQRLIVTSSTYRQSSGAFGEAFETDPSNRLLARGPRFRLPAESIRDNALAISGLLTQRIGGPSIKPYQPEGLWEELAGGAGEPAYVPEPDDNLYRRSLYIYRKRTVPHPTMTTFDGTSREICTVARGRTNTPLQALALLNGVTYVEAARHLATHSIHYTDALDQRLQFAFRSATCRLPNDEELVVLKRALEKYQSQFADSPDNAKSYISVGQSKPDPGCDAVELAAYTAVCSVILNLDEVITKE